MEERSDKNAENGIDTLIVKSEDDVYHWLVSVARENGVINACLSGLKEKMSSKTSLILTRRLEATNDDM